MDLNPQIRLIRVPGEKYPQGEDVFQIKYVPPVPTSDVPEHHVVVKNLYISIDATMRVWISGIQSYLPPVQPQDVMRAFCVGQVIYSRSKKLKVGDLAMGLIGWQKYAVLDQKELTPLPRGYPHPEHFLGVLGISGLTAYFGLHSIGRIKKSEVVVVSAAAGAVGEIAVQLAKNHGCIVCGIAGTDDKCQYVKQLGADTVINYKKQDVLKELKKLHPEGVDVYFDNVGGKMLDDVLMVVRNEARVVLCGLISTYGSKDPYRLKNYARLITKRASMQGFLYFDYAKQFPQAIAELQQQMSEGKMKTRVDMLYGIEECPRGLRRLLMGENEGKVIVQVEHKKESQRAKL